MLSALWNWMDRIAEVAHGQRPAAPTARERELAAEMRHAVEALPPVESLSTADAWWVDCARQFRAGMTSDDPRAFTRWPIVRTTMFLRNQRISMVTWRILKSLPDFRTRWLPAIAEVPAGRPTPLLWAGSTSGQAVFHATTAAVYERLAGRPVAGFPTIVEWGGGYGGMCRLVHRLGFNGRYVIYDLPELSILQRYYLQSVGLPVLDEAAWLAGASGIHLTSNLGDFLRLLGATPIDEALFWAAWSLSETPEAGRAAIMPLIARMRSYMISYQRTAAGADNAAYFEARANAAGPAWRRAVEPVPRFGENYWSVGVRTDR